MTLAALAPTFDDFLLWLGSFGGFVLLILAVTLWKPGGASLISRVNAMLDARAARIEAQLRMAEENQEAARRAQQETEAEIAAARGEAAEIVARADELQGSLRQELTAAAEQDRLRIVGLARDEIEAERNRAIMDLRAKAADAAVDAAREVLRRTMDERMDREIVAQTLKEDSQATDGSRS